MSNKSDKVIYSVADRLKRNVETYSDRDLEQYAKRKKSEPSSISESKLVGNNVVIPEIYENIENENVDIIKQYQPPYVPNMTDDEYKTVVRYEKNYMDKQLNLISQDKILDFIDTVAGLSFTDEKMLRSTGPKPSVGDVYTSRYSNDVDNLTGVTRGVGSPPVFPIRKEIPSARRDRLIRRDSDTPAPVTPLTTAVTEAKFSQAKPGGSRNIDDDDDDEFSSEDESSGDEDDPNKKQKKKEEAEQKRQNEILGKGSKGSAEEIYDLLNDPKSAASTQDYISRRRMQTNMHWIEKYDVLGAVRMTSLMKSNMNLAYASIKHNPNFKGAALLDFIQDDEMTTHFAALVAQYITFAKCKGGPRNQLDAAFARLKSEISHVKIAMNEFRWDTIQKKFVHNSTDNENMGQSNYNPFGSFKSNDTTGFLYPINY